jgi:beta-N-acetylhexosaminidase
VVFGLSGSRLTEEERRLFADCNPLGFILFSRNCVDAEQVRTLVASLRETVGRADAPVLIDQEGGRVQRLRPPRWRAAPAAAVFGSCAAEDEAAAVEAAWLNARLMAAELLDLGVTIDCAPVLDVPQPDADPIIGDRAFCSRGDVVALLGHAVCQGFLAGGVLPVIKHIPGHGRAKVDSHAALPVVDATLDALRRVDFAPFAALAGMPWAMTAHVVYAAIDASAPATTSARVIEHIIRGEIGFDGVLISDDLGMQALSGGPGERAAAALAAGCDLVLHCSGALDEMAAVAAVCPPVGGSAADRLARAEAMRQTPAAPVEPAEAALRLDTLLQGVTA